MKKLSIFTIIFTIAFAAISQPPQGFKYQTVVRDAIGEVVSNQAVDFRLTIRANTPNGTIVYRETQLITTNAFGLANLVIGQGSPVSGIFANIDWRDGQKYLQVETDQTGSYVTMGTAELLSVPYAMYAGSDWQRVGNNLHYDIGKIGIGTASPGSNLHIYDPVNSAGFVLESNNFTTFQLKSLSSDYTFSGDDYSGSLRLRNNNTNNYNMQIYDDNVGIGHFVPPSGPAYKLDVLGDINFTGDLYNNGNLFTGPWTDYGFGIYYTGGEVAIGTTNPVALTQISRNDEWTNSQLWIEQSGTGDATIGFSTGITGDDWAIGVDQSDGEKLKIGQSYDASINTALTIDHNLEVGIGTNNPSSLLHVAYDGFSSAQLGHSDDYTSYFYHYEEEANGDGQAAIYAYRTRDTRNDGTGYSHYGSNAAIKGYSYWGDSYTFGTSGINYNDYERSGGILGANSSGTYWGSLGYKNSAGSTYGGYFTSYTTGTGDNMVYSSIGTGSWGDLFGADIHGKIYGTYTEGAHYGMFSNGMVFKNDLDIHLQQTGSQNAVLYTNVSTDVTVQTSGYVNLVDGSCSILFDQEFAKVVSKSEPVVVTVTPVGNTNGIHLAEITSDGFIVTENNNGKSNATVSYIAIGKRAGYENPDLPEEVVDVNYLSKLNQGLHNDNIKETNGAGVYLENGKLMVGTPPDASLQLPKPDEAKAIDINRNQTANKTKQSNANPNYINGRYINEEPLKKD